MHKEPSKQQQRHKAVVDECGGCFGAKVPHSKINKQSLINLVPLCPFPNKPTALPLLRAESIVLRGRRPAGLPIHITGPHLCKPLAHQCAQSGWGPTAWTRYTVGRSDHTPGGRRLPHSEGYNVDTMSRVLALRTTTSHRFDDGGGWYDDAYAGSLRTLAVGLLAPRQGSWALRSSVIAQRKSIAACTASSLAVQRVKLSDLPLLPLRRSKCGGPSHSTCPVVANQHPIPYAECCRRASLEWCNRTY